MRVKILHITYSMDEGGVDTLLLELLPLIQNQDVQIEVLVLCKGRDRLKHILEKKGIKVIVGKYRNIYNPLNILFIRSLLRRYDIIHSHLFPAQYFLIFASMFLKKRPKLVTTEHCTTNGRRKIAYFKPLEKFIYKRYDKIIGVSEQAAINLSKWVGFSENMMVIPNGIHLSRIYNAKSCSKQDFGMDDSDIVLMMVARFFSQKDHATVIRAMKELDTRFKLIFVGSGELMEQCQALSVELGLSKQIIFLGNRDDVPSLIKMADIGILSTHFEGLPISVLEFMAAGKPVIGSDVDGVRELVGHKDLLFPVGNAHALANCINNLLTQKRMKVIGSEMLQKSFLYDIKNTANSYYNMYTSLLME